MEKQSTIPLPIAEEDDMCPKVAMYVLRKKYPNLPDTRSNCPLGQFILFVNYGLRQYNLGLKIYEKPLDMASAKLKLVTKKYDGVLLLRDKTKPEVFHFIAFIVQNNEVLFYDADEGRLITYRLKQGATPYDFEASFSAFFPEYNIVQIDLIEPSRMQGGKRITDPEAYKKKALDTLKEHNITPMMVYTALLTKKIYKGQKVVSKMFNFKTWGHITNDHVFEVKSKDGQLFRYKIGYRRKNQNYHSLLAKAPGSFYTQIFTHRAHGYDSDRAFEEGFQMQEKRQLTRKLKLKPRYRKTRKN